MKRDSLYKNLVLTILAGLAALTVAMANRDVYSKDQVDLMMDAQGQHTTDLEALELHRHQTLEEDITEIKEDVRWIVRRMGGVSNADTGQGDRSP